MRAEIQTLIITQEKEAKTFPNPKVIVFMKMIPSNKTKKDKILLIKKFQL